MTVVGVGSMDHQLQTLFLKPILAIAGKTVFAVPYQWLTPLLYSLQSQLMYGLQQLAITGRLRCQEIACILQ
jgi:hypothetical protein